MAEISHKEVKKDEKNRTQRALQNDVSELSGYRHRKAALGNARCQPTSGIQANRQRRVTSSKNRNIAENPEDKRNQLCTWRGGEADWIS